MSWLFWIVFSSLVWAEEIGYLAEKPILEPPPQEEVETRTYGLAKILRCPVCQGLSVADSRSDAAVAMKNRIEELVALGYDDEQIIDYFVQRYGEFTLLRPKDEHWIVWTAPKLLLYWVFWLLFYNCAEKKRSRQKSLSASEKGRKQRS